MSIANNLLAPDAGQSVELAKRINDVVVDYCKEIGAADADVRLVIESSLTVQVGYLKKLDAFTAYMLVNHAIKGLCSGITTAADAAYAEAVDGAKSS